MPDIFITSFYHFTPLDDLARMRRRALAMMDELRVRGSILIAREGINGCVAGARGDVDAMLAWLRAQPKLARMKSFTARGGEIPFKRAKVKIKKEIVTLGIKGIDARAAAEYVAPEDWNALLDDEEVLLLDVRNQYETDIGGFAGARNPQTENFREFPDFVARNFDAAKDKKIAMYCTGGIRCEKASAYLQSRGFARVFQLQGGVLNYLAHAPDDSKWRGECFVFDERVSVDRKLRRGNYAQCHACRRPLSAAAQRSPHYIPGQSCPHCHARTTDAARARFAERHMQTELANKHGRAHLGPEAMPVKTKKLRSTILPRPQNQTNAD